MICQYRWCLGYKLLKKVLNKVNYVFYIDYGECNLSSKQIKKDYLLQPPFNEEVSTNIRKEFFTLLNKHFPPSNKYHKIFDKNYIN